MKAKIDENLPSSVARLLVEHGHDAVTVIEEGLSGASDARVAEVAKAEGRLLLTLDRGFADVRAYPPGSHPGIVVFRLLDQRSQSVREAVLALLRQHDLTDLRGCIAVVQANMIRIRRPPA